MIKTLPIYLATIADADDGVYSMSLVDYPATEINWVTFSEDKPIQRFSIQDEEEHLLCGAVMLADTNIYRRDGDYEYYIRYDRETIKTMAEKMLSDNTFNRIDFMHNDEIIPEGTVNLVELFIKDEAKGINPSYLENIPDGSLLCTYKVNDDELWELCKDGTFQGFSLTGYFTPVPMKQNNNFKKNTMMSKIKDMVAKILAQFGAIATDKGTLVWEGEADLKEGDIVTLEDGNQPEDGEYKTEDGKVITIEEGKVAKIEDGEAEVAPEEAPVEMSSAKQKFEAKKAQFEASYQEIEQNIYSALSNMGSWGYLIENGDDYAIVSEWGSDDREHLFRYEISIAEDGTVTLGAKKEVKVEYVDADEAQEEPAQEPEEAPAQEVEMAAEEGQEEPAQEEPAQEEEKDEIDALKDEIEALKAEIETIKESLADIVEKPAVEPIAQEFEKVTEISTGNAKLDKVCRRVATLRK